MKAFSSFLVESRGASTARSGHANEIFSNDFFNHYVKHFDKAIKSGKSEEEAHKRATKAVRDLKYDHEYHRNRTDLEPKTAAQIKKSVEELGPENSESIFHSSKNSFEGPVEYLRQRYPGVKLINAIHAGAGQTEGNADNVLNLRHEQKNKTAGLHMDHSGPPEMSKYGLSQKYSTKLTDEATKIHSPGVRTLISILNNHHREMFGNDSTIDKDLKKAVKTGQDAQRASVLETNSRGSTHHKVLSDLVQKLKDDVEQSKATGNPPKYMPAGIKQKDWESKVRNAKYEQIVHPKTGELQGANFNQHLLSILRGYNDEHEKFNKGKLASKTGGINHKAIGEAYSSINNANSQMKGLMADAIHKHISKILGHTSGDPQEQARIDDIKHRFHRSLLNVQEPTEKTLPTMLVKTLGDGTTHISDANEAFLHNYGDASNPNSDNVNYTKKSKGAGSFRVGSSTLTLDSRPGTMHDPLINPVNFTLPGTFFKPVSRTYRDGKFDKEVQPAETKKTPNTKTRLPYNRPGAGRVPQTDSPMSTAPKPGIAPRITIDADAEHGGTQFYAPHEKNLMKGL